MGYQQLQPAEEMFQKWAASSKSDRDASERVVALQAKYSSLHLEVEALAS